MVQQGTSVGPSNAKIAILGEAFGAEEAKEGKPFVGSSGAELDRMLKDAGITRNECWISNVTNRRPPGNDIEQWFLNKSRAAKEGVEPFNGRYPREPIREGMEILFRELRELQPNVIIAFGNTPLWALTGEKQITKWRGSILEGNVEGMRVKVVPTYHPAAILRQWPWRYPAVQDLRKAVKESKSPEIPQKERNFTPLPSFDEAMDTLDWLINHLPMRLSVDIEAVQQQMSCVGIAWSKKDAMVIPLMSEEGSYWDIKQEFELVKKLRELLTDPGARVVGQNFLFDCQYFARQWGFIPNTTDDSMIAHHALFPGLPKGLDFLSSLYCEAHSYWKDDIKLQEKLGTNLRRYLVYNCLTPETPVLTSDLRWVPLGSVKVGDELLAVEEETEEGRKSRRVEKALVTRKEDKRDQIWEVVCKDGTRLKGTKDHRLLVETSRGRKWKEIGELKDGDRIVRLTNSTWGGREGFEAGWLAGMFDGEGCVRMSHNKKADTYTLTLKISQKYGPVKDRLEKSLWELGLPLARFPGGPSNVPSMAVSGGLPKTLETLGRLRPTRLIENYLEGLKDVKLGGLARKSFSEVADIVHLGSGEVVDITTTSGTFIANGMVVHNCEDTVRTYEVMDVLDTALEKSGLYPIYEYQMSLFYPVLRMMMRGIKMDNSKRQGLAKELEGKQEELLGWMGRVTGRELNPQSPKQLQEYFYKHLNLPVIKNQKTGNPSTDINALKKLSKKEPLVKPLADALVKYRSVGNIKSNVLDKDPDWDHRMRCSVNIAGTETFRLTSSENAFGSALNMQTISEGENKGLPNLRKLFVPESGFRIGEFDLDRADQQFVAWDSGCETLKDKLRRGIDIHLSNAKILYNLPFTDADLEDIEKAQNLAEEYAKYRKWAKPMPHAGSYGVKAKTLSQSLGISIRDAESMLSAFFSEYPEIYQWQMRIWEQLLDTRSVTNPFGYRRFFFDRMEEAWKEALSYVPQSGVANVTNFGLRNIDAELWPDVQPLLVIHDSLLVQFPDENVDYWVKRIKEAMEVTVPYDDPLIIPVDGKTSNVSWGDA